MRAYDDDRRRTRDRSSFLAAGDFRLDVVTRLSARFIAISSGSQPGSRKRIFDKIGSGIERYVMPHVALADFSGQLLHIRAELFAQADLIWRQQLRLGNILPRHPHSKPPE